MTVDIVERLCRLAPFCPAPLRVAPSHWMSHIPFAFWLVDILRPRMLVELGSYHGVSFCAFCQRIEQLGLSCEAYAVDLWQGDAHMGRYGGDVYSNLAEYVAGHYPGFASLLRCSFDDAQPKFEDNSIDLLHLDGCHTCEAILHDFENWLPKMSNRGVVLIHDTRARLPGYGGVDAWQTISARFPSFVFNHGYGLGVAATGKDAPAQLKELANLDGAGLTDFIGLFQQQGKIYERLFALEDKRRREEALAKANLAEAKDVQRQLQTILERERAEHAKECEAYEQERELLKESLLQTELRAQAYAGSFSWKITAPLRKLARLCR